ncbi:MAG: type III restriction endonuclease subunit R, partial [Candidatus Entotheonellia bacterium]
LRLPYGKRAGVAAVDRLSIVAHDKFQEIIDEANRPDSAIRLQQVILDPTQDLQRLVTVVSQSNIEAQITPSASPLIAGPASSVSPQPIFTNEIERKIAQVTYDIIRRHENLPSSAYLLQDDVQQSMIREVEEALAPVQLEIAGVAERPDIATIVHKTTSMVVNHTIDIPRILVVPTGEVSSGFQPFSLDTSGIHYQPVDRDLLIQHLRTHEQETLSFSGSQQQEQRLEDYLVRGLIDYDDISYDDHADLLYDLAEQMVKHLLSYLAEEEARNVVIYHQRQLVEFIHVQMQTHYWEKATGYDVIVRKGFTELRPSAFTAATTESIHDFRETVQDRSRIGQMLFDGFQRCLYAIQKFQSDSERKLAIILDREALKWFKPARGQFQMYYKLGADHLEYQPDFVAETADCIYMLEAKARNEMQDAEVQAKKDAAVEWCRHATTHTMSHGGKPWTYLLVPHDAISENMTLAGLTNQFRVD